MRLQRLYLIKLEICYPLWNSTLFQAAILLVEDSFVDQSTVESNFFCFVT